MVLFGVKPIFVIFEKRPSFMFVGLTDDLFVYLVKSMDHFNVTS